MVRTRSAKPSVMAWRTLPANRACVPTRTKNTGMPASEQTKCSSRSAASALCSMMRSVRCAVSLRSLRSASRSAALVSSGIRLSERSYKRALTVRMVWASMATVSTPTPGLAIGFRRVAAAISPALTGSIANTSASTSRTCPDSQASSTGSGVWRTMTSCPAASIMAIAAGEPATDCAVTRTLQRRSGGVAARSGS